jgi:ATP-dependent Lhr-like helicase
MTVHVAAAEHKQPTVPSWVSEMLPLSFDLAMNIGRFRRLLEEKFNCGYPKEEIIAFIHDYLYVDEKAARGIYHYFNEQFTFSTIPTDNRIVVEHFTDNNRFYSVFHTLYGRRVNDCLSRALAYLIGKKEKRDVAIGITDNGFYISSEKRLNPSRLLTLLNEMNLQNVLHHAIDKSEVFSRRFRHCATRSLMILRHYHGNRKNVARQQMGSRILMNAVKRISNEFPILQEARREVLEDLMDYDHTREVIARIHQGTIEVKDTFTVLPSPFSLAIITQGHTDIIRIEEREEFLRRMHQMIKAKIALDEGKKRRDRQEFSFD